MSTWCSISNIFSKLSHLSDFEWSLRGQSSSVRINLISLFIIEFFGILFIANGHYGSQLHCGNWLIGCRLIVHKRQVLHFLCNVSNLSCWGCDICMNARWYALIICTNITRDSILIVMLLYSVHCIKTSCYYWEVRI